MDEGRKRTLCICAAILSEPRRQLWKMERALPYKRK